MTERAKEQRWLLHASLGKVGGPVSVSLYFAGVRRKLMSYNAENFHTDSNGQVVKNAASVQALADVILDQDPDVIALQEVGDRQLLSEFNRQYLRGKYPVIVTSPTASPRHIGVAILCKPNIQVVQMKNHGAGLYSSPGSKRDLLEATFETETGYRFTILNVHFKSMVGRKTRPLMRKTVLKNLRQQPNFQQLLDSAHDQDEKQTLPARMKEVSYAATLVRNHLCNDPRAHIFVTGDFNSLHHTACGKQVLDIMSLRYYKNRYKNFMAEVMLKDGKPAPTHGPGLFPAAKLDYTFVSNALVKRVINAFVPGAFDQDPWKIASDHLPLVTEFEEPDALPKRKKQGLRLTA